VVRPDPPLRVSGLGNGLTPNLTPNFVVGL
jgi:hypothetical protein